MLNVCHKGTSNFALELIKIAKTTMVDLDGERSKRLSSKSNINLVLKTEANCDGLDSFRNFAKFNEVIKCYKVLI